MNKDTAKGTINDAAGRAKRQIGEWTNDPDKQVEGAAQQIKGKAQKAVGQVKDAVSDAKKPPASNPAGKESRDEDYEKNHKQAH